LGGRDQECGSKPAWANSSQDPISKILEHIHTHKNKRAGRVAQVVEHLPYSHEFQMPVLPKKKKLKKQKIYIYV
jgi:hypothetical protein